MLQDFTAGVHMHYLQAKQLLVFLFCPAPMVYTGVEVVAPTFAALKRRRRNIGIELAVRMEHQ